jgi:archaellum component FlaG (FlaF/FlaG flagellin family)
MKTLSRTFTFGVLAVVAIIAVLSLRAFATTPCQQISGHKWKYHKMLGGPGSNSYAELKKPQKDFDDALIKLKNNGGDYCIRFLCKAQGKPEEPYDPHHHQVCINTDKVTKSKVASATTDADVANDPNAVHYLYSDYQPDIDAVLASFK